MTHTNLFAPFTVLAAYVAAALTFTTPQDTKPATDPAAPTSTAATFTVDDTHSMSLFRVEHMGAGKFWGRFNEVSGTAQYVPNTSLAMNVTIQTASVDSGNKKLDGHLKSPDFFNAVEFPTMTFLSTSAKALGTGRFDVTGDLTMHGITKSVTVPVQCSAISVMGGTSRSGFEATFEIKRSDFGVSYGVEKGAIGDETRVIVSLECIDRSTVPTHKE
ncbi:MAG: YceI family protein [Phycisphaerales bacterium]|nr:YceI family protein [Phycisphaerales bacterium]